MVDYKTLEYRQRVVLMTGIYDNLLKRSEADVELREILWIHRMMSNVNLDIELVKWREMMAFMFFNSSTAPLKLGFQRVLDFAA